MEAAALTIRSRCLAAAASRPAHGGVHRRATAATAPARRRHCRPLPLRALPPELSEILAPKLVPGSPADTGDVSSLIPISAVMLLLYLVSNWVFPAVIMKGMKPDADTDADEAAASASASASASAASISSTTPLKVKKKKKKKSRKAATEA